MAFADLAKLEAKASSQRAETVQRAADVQEVMMAEALREVTVSAAAKTTEAIRKAVADGQAAQHRGAQEPNSTLTSNLNQNLRPNASLSEVLQQSIVEALQSIVR